MAFFCSYISGSDAETKRRGGAGSEYYTNVGRSSATARPNVDPIQGENASDGVYNKRHLPTPCLKFAAHE